MSHNQLRLLGFLIFCAFLFLIGGKALFFPKIPAILLDTRSAIIEDTTVRPQPENNKEIAEKALPEPSTPELRPNNTSAPAIEAPALTLESVQSSKQTFVQAGSFGDIENAQNMQKKLQRQKYNVRIVAVESGGKTYHRVLIGPIKEEQGADYIQKLKASNIEARIIHF